MLTNLHNSNSILIHCIIVMDNSTTQNLWAETCTLMMGGWMELVSTVKTNTGVHFWCLHCKKYIEKIVSVRKKNQKMTWAGGISLQQ